MIIVLAGCMVVDPSHFKYLDNEDLEFQPLLIIGAEQDVEISLPTSLATTLPDTLFVKPDSLELAYIKVLGFPYEWHWGGPIHEDKQLYFFELGFHRRVDQALMDLDFEERTRLHRQRYESFENGKWRDIVLERLSIVEHRSSQGYTWLLENMPSVIPHHEVFSLPTSNEWELVIRFWYNEDWVKDHPEWFERRKLLSRRILDTVKLLKPAKSS